MADDRYDDDYWGQHSFMRSLMNDAPLSTNVLDQRAGDPEPGSLLFDDTRDAIERGRLYDAFWQFFTRADPYPAGNPEAFVPQDPLR